MQKVADQHSGAIGQKSKQCLGAGANLFWRDSVRIELPGDEEEVIADTMENDTEKDHPGDFGWCAHVS